MRQQSEGRIADRIRDALLRYERETGAGYALSDSVAFVVSLPNRTTFSPDAAFTVQRPENDEDFVFGAPIFAAEVRSKYDYGTAGDEEYRQKRADYFAAGTRVVWHVNPPGTRDRRVPRGCPRCADHLP